MSRRRRRSKAYPVEGLGEAEGTAQALFGALGEAPFDREAGVEALGHGSASGGRGGRRLAGLVQLGLLSRRAGKYALTQRGLRLLRPSGEEERREMRREAVLAPPLYRAVYERFRPGGRLPAHLENVLQRDFGITVVAAASAARTLRASFHLAGLVDGEGVFWGEEDGHEGVASAAREGAGRKVEARPSLLGGMLVRPEDAMGGVSTAAPGQDRYGGRDATGTTTLGSTDSTGRQGSTGTTGGAGRPQFFELRLSAGMARLEFPAVMTPEDLEILRQQLKILELPRRSQGGS